MPEATNFHVVIERPREAGAEGVARLASAVASRYGLPAAQLRDRLAVGSLRVKSNVDRATADRYVAELETLGAVCAVLDAATGKPVIAAPAARVSKPAIASGLAAAYSGAAAPQDLGALSSGEYALATLDGADDAPAADGARFAPPDPAALPASIGPAVAAPVADADHDRFAPPDAEQEIPLDLDVAPRPARAPKPETAPPVRAAAAAPAAAPASGSLAIATPSPSPSPSGLAGLVADPRARLAAGVALAILLGFVPAHVVASVREDSAYAKIDRELEARYAAVIDHEDHAALDGHIARLRAHKEDTRRDIALSALAVWALAGGAFAFVWFRKLDWDAIGAKLQP